MAKIRRSRKSAGEREGYAPMTRIVQTSVSGSVYAIIHGTPHAKKWGIAAAVHYTEGEVHR